MKKNTKFEELKALVNSTDAERVKLCTAGVKAYNIAKGEEYCVIVAFAKINGRYYFIDREDRRYLSSRYDRAEFVAGEMLEIIANDAAAAEAAADQIERAGSVLVDAELLPLFFAACDRRGINVTSTSAGFDDLGRMLTRYDRVSPTNDKQTDHNDSTTADTIEPETEAPDLYAVLLFRIGGIRYYICEGSPEDFTPCRLADINEEDVKEYCSRFASL